jgi:hypothetical protein
MKRDQEKNPVQSETHYVTEETVLSMVPLICEFQFPIHII